jgi:centrosomal protein CEP76
MESTTMPVDCDNVSSIRSAIDAKLHEDGVYQQIRELILSKAPALTKDDRSPQPPPSDDPDDATPQHKIEDNLIREVLQSELVQQLLDAIKLDKELKQNQATTGEDDDEQAENEPLPVSEPTLFLRLAGGRAFLDQLTQDDDDLNGDAGDGIASVTQHQIGLVRQFFRVIVSFQGQRQSTRDVVCCVDPPFNEHFRFSLAKKRTRSGRTKSGGLYEIEVVSPWEALCLVDEPVHITLVKLTKKVTSFQHAAGAVWHELRRELIAVHRLDWRRILGSTLQLVHAPIQLVDKMKVPVGTLDVRMDLLHFHRTAAIAKDVTAYLSKEALEKNTLSHAFYRYAKEWWHTYRAEMDAMETNVRHQPTGASEREESLEDRQFVLLGQRSRLVKLFAEDDEGRFRMVCKFLSALCAPLAVKSPSEAARFVALLPLETTSVVGGVTDDAWRSVATTLAVGKGDTQDHAVSIVSTSGFCKQMALIHNAYVGRRCSRRCCSAVGSTPTSALAQ